MLLLASWLFTGLLVVGLVLGIKDQFVRYVYGVRPGVHICGGILASCWKENC